MKVYERFARNPAPRTVPFERGKEPPPVENRPCCKNCNKRLQPHIYGGYTTVADGTELRHWAGTYHGYDNRWCSLRCARQFANKAYDSGFRSS